MRSDLFARARLSAVRAVHLESSCGVRLGFGLDRSRLEVDEIEDYADLGPELTTEAIFGFGKVHRVLRAARISGPRDPAALAGCADEAARLLSRAIGVELRLTLRRRSTLRFKAWTETGYEVVEDVEDIREDDDAYWVLRRGSRVPIRLDREEVVRRCTEAQHWFEILGIERA